MIDHYQRQQLTAALTIGCDRDTAAAFIRLTRSQLEQEIDQHEDLANDVRHAEAAAEMQHMRNLHAAAADQRNWRASTWWLESRNPEKYARKPDAVTPKELNEYSERLVRAILEDLPDELRETIGEKLTSITKTLDES